MVAEPDAAKRTAIDALWPSINSVGAVAAAFEAMPYGEASVLLAVKPQMLPRVAEEIETAAGDSMLEGSCILSILAGVTTQKLGETLKGRVVRAMPNLPAKVGMIQMLWHSSAINDGIIRLRENDGGQPGAILREVTFSTTSVGWGGDVFDEPYPVLAGEQYFVTFASVTNDYRDFVAVDHPDAVQMTYYWQPVDSGPSWNGPFFGAPGRRPIMSRGITIGWIESATGLWSGSVTVAGQTLLPTPEYTQLVTGGGAVGTVPYGAHLFECSPAYTASGPGEVAVPGTQITADITIVHYGIIDYSGTGKPYAVYESSGSHCSSGCNSEFFSDKTSEWTTTSIGADASLRSMATVALQQARSRTLLSGANGQYELTTSAPTTRPTLGPIERAGVYLLESPAADDQRAVTVNVVSPLESRVATTDALPDSFGGLGSRESGMVDAAIIATREAPELRYEILLMDRSSERERLIGDLSTRGDLLLVTIATPHGHDFVMGRDALGEWSLRRDGTVERGDPSGAAPRWIDLGDSTILVGSLDGLLGQLRDDFTIERSDGEAGPSLVATRRADVHGPGPSRVEIWVDDGTSLVDRLELHTERPAPGGRRERGEGGDRHPPRGEHAVRVMLAH